MENLLQSVSSMFSFWILSLGAEVILSGRDIVKSMQIMTININPQ